MSDRQSEPRESTVRDLLLQIADRLTARYPGNEFTATGRLAVIQATTLDPALSRMLNERMPQIDGPVSRGAYAVMLRALATGDATSGAEGDTVAELHRLCDEDYAQGEAYRDLEGLRDDAFLLASAAETASDAAQDQDNDGTSGTGTT